MSHRQKANGFARALLVLTALVGGVSMAQAAGHGCPRPECPPYYADYWGYFPTCWRPWPAGWHEQCQKVVHMPARTAVPEPLPPPVEKKAAPIIEKLPEKAPPPPPPKPLPDMSKKATPAREKGTATRVDSHRQATVVFDLPATTKSPATAADPRPATIIFDPMPSEQK